MMPLESSHVELGLARSSLVEEVQSFVAISAGPHGSFNDAISFLVNCTSQAEIDRYWNALLANGQACCRRFHLGCRVWKATRTVRPARAGASEPWPDQLAAASLHADLGGPFPIAYAAAKLMALKKKESSASFRVALRICTGNPGQWCAAGWSRLA
jgi:3-demethylubiquinone-9 3-methyltransferase